MKKVVKFGGSSLASAEQFKKVGNIIRKEESRRYVIPSAPGKRTPDDTKVTDMLYSCYGQAILGEDAERDFEEQLEAIKERYNSIIRGLNLDLSLDEEFKTIRTNFSKKIGRDYAASRGEYLNGIIMAAYLGYEFIDAAEVIVFDENGNFAYAVKLNVGKNDIAIHIEPTEENKNNPDIFNNNEEAIGFATKDLNLEITRLEEGEEIPGPVINAEDKIVNLGDEFNPLDGVTAIDALGNDITEKIEVLENTVDTSKEGEYKVVYKVADDNGKEATREIKVTVTKNEEGKKPGIDIKHEEDNNKPEAIPKTGGTNVIYYIGIALILIAGGMYFTFKKKNIS